MEENAGEEAVQEMLNAVEEEEVAVEEENAEDDGAGEEGTFTLKSLMCTIIIITIIINFYPVTIYIWPCSFCVWVSNGSIMHRSTCMNKTIKYKTFSI